ncbi:two-component sensor histidine kinase [Ornithinimicrobium sp. CNJ-824]|uniref:sensor histidine kinase n=1 Tax=Ornithinimicrobium sp. CNJ-824 TaxID=1904966 RepID=UPI0009693798|nr:HAMP domain-containing sensor histidine kinase [Ornithinimicrobium sp. CNJ-824]OLT22622.1 two-component sensor histidine kinase [Ornithinimicrobium sp. CNJ-824]
MVGQAVVLVAGALTVGLVAAVVGPPIFHEHLLRAGLPEGASEMVHVELAYRDASLLAVGLGLLISLLAAGGVTWFLTRLLRRPLADLTDAAQELERGHYDARVPDVGSGTELDTLAEAFNVMAARLEGVEDTRRRLLSDLAHELRTPIATLTAYHEGLSDGLVPPGPETRAVLAEQTDRLARLAQDIDEVSRAEEGRLLLDRRPVAVPDLLRLAAETMREAYARKQVDLLVDVDPAAGPHLVVDVDPVRVGQVLTNVLGNALRHTAPGGQVTVRAVRDGAVAVVEIVDDGEGIPAHQLPHVFERFFRGDSARDRDRSGSGIGLTISRAIVEAHGGTLSAASDGPGTGATLRLALPLGSPSNLHRT